MKEIEEDTSKWKNIHDHGSKEYLKNVQLPKAIYRFISISIRIPIALFTEIGKKILLFMGNKKDLE